MVSTTPSNPLIKVDKVKVSFDLNHFRHFGIRDLFVTVVTHPWDYFLKPRELFMAVDDVSFELTEGMRLGIVGRNGSGKTTLCRCLSGMIVPQKGTITTSAEIQAIFDTGTGVMPDLTGRENAYLLARLFFTELKDLKPVVEEALAFSELGHFLDIPFRQYSKGMQSRLMLSLISAKTTDVLILDEVFDGADIFFQEKLAKRMTEFIDRARATIFVSHSKDQIRQVCNTLMVMDKGKILYLGEVNKGLELYEAQGL